MRSLFYSKWLFSILFVGLTLLSPQPVAANMGPPSAGGQLSGEPTGLEAVEILHETLTIDLRPLATYELIEVEAFYEIDNHDQPKQVDLVFPTGAQHVSKFQVWHNQDQLQHHPVSAKDTIAEWQVPQYTPALHGEDSGKQYPWSEWAQYNTAVIGFALPLVSGRQTIRVRYQAEVTTNYQVDYFPGHPFYYPTQFYQFAYILAPARSWAGFGGLDVTIHLPPDWLAASEPPLMRTGDQLTGQFAELPADAFALTLQPPAGITYWLLRITSWVLFPLVFVGGGLFCSRVGRSRAKNNRSGWGASLGTAVLWSLLTIASGSFLLLGPEQVISDSIAANSGYELILYTLLLIVGSIPLIPIGYWIAIRTFNRYRVVHEPTGA